VSHMLSTIEQQNPEQTEIVPLQITVQLGLLVAGDSVEYCLIFAI